MKANRLSLGIVCFLAILIVCLPLARANAAEIIFEEDFEAGWGLWYADNGVWQVGEPTAGPPSAHGGVQCAGTILGGDYPSDTDSRLVSPSITLPDAAAGEEIYLRFWQCFSYAGGAGCDFGRVQISVWDEGIGEWSSWGDIGNIIADYSPWSKMGIDLTAYAGESVRIAFSHSAVGSYPCASSSTGWYIDDIEIIKKVPQFTGDFELGWEDWSADRGVWQVGEPTAGPPSAHGGVQCAGTILGGDYPSDTDSRLVSPSITLPDAAAGEEIYLRFWQCFSYAGGAGCDFGRVQISVWDEGIGEWSSWGDIGNKITDASVWSPKIESLTAYAGESVRIAFSHSAVGSYPCASSSTGWYIDDIDFPGISPVIDDIIFDEYAPPPVTSMITVAAHDPVGGNLSYNWNALDGGEIIGQGSEVDFAPPENIQFCPYRVRVAVCSDLTHICSARIIGVYTRLPGDANGDGYVNTKDQKQVRNHFGESGTPGWVNADVNCDGFVNTKDQKQVRNYFGQSAP